ncbi:MAG: hypothetical protein KJO77_03190 [Bacteroidia bacterium]|nr:hypothetical protein [Bacteroidia bacterium]NND52533.1 hypothetical protein [Flavobacteriaceae bacterium]
MKSKLFLVSVLALFVLSSCTQNIESYSAPSDASFDAKDPEGCETAFGFFKAGCFNNDGFNRWGWVIGPISEPHNESYPLYAGAGKCMEVKGELVGTVSINYMDDYIEVEYETIADYLIFETHVYVGNEKYPTKPNGQQTVAPGQYGNSQSDSEGTHYVSYKIDDVSGELYVIAHAVVCPKKPKG